MKNTRNHCPDRHSRFFAPSAVDVTSSTEQNLRLSQAEKAIDMANGRIPLLPPAVYTPPSGELLPPELSAALALYHSPMTDYAVKASLLPRLKAQYAAYIAESSAKAAQEADALKASKEAEYAALLARLSSDIAKPL